MDYQQLPRIFDPKKSSDKTNRPEYLGVTGGSVVAGETSFQDCIREVREEIGIDVEMANAIVMTRINGNNTLWDIWVIRQDFGLNQTRLQLEEVIEVKWTSKNEIMRLAKEKQFLQCGYLPELFGYIDDGHNV